MPYKLLKDVPLQPETKAEIKATIEGLGGEFEEDSFKTGFEMSDRAANAFATFLLPKLLLKKGDKFEFKKNGRIEAWLEHWTKEGWFEKV